MLWLLFSYADECSIFGDDIGIVTASQYNESVKLGWPLRNGKVVTSSTIQVPCQGSAQGTLKTITLIGPDFYFVKTLYFVWHHHCSLLTISLYRKTAYQDQRGGKYHWFREQDLKALNTMCKTERHTWNLSLSVEHVQQFCWTWQILLFMWIKSTPHNKQFVMTQHENFHSTWWIYNICCLIVIYPVLSQNQLCRDLRVFGVKLVSNFWAGNDVGSCVCT